MAEKARGKHSDSCKTVRAQADPQEVRVEKYGIQVDWGQSVDQGCSQGLMAAPVDSGHGDRWGKAGDAGEGSWQEGEAVSSVPLASGQVAARGSGCP